MLEFVCDLGQVRRPYPLVLRFTMPHNLSFNWCDDRGITGSKDDSTLGTFGQ